MRKLIVSIHSTFNGVVTGPTDDPTNFMTWIAEGGIDDTSKDYAKNFDNVDVLMLGRATYEDLVRKWPMMTGELADIINNLPKIIVAGEHKVENPKWGDFAAPTQLTGNDIEDQVKSLKEQDGGDIITFGSPTLLQSLTNADLIDEYRIFVHPVIVDENGRKRLFENIVDRKDLKLLSTQSFEHGVVLVCYEIVKSNRLN